VVAEGQSLPASPEGAALDHGIPGNPHPVPEHLATATAPGKGDARSDNVNLALLSPLQVPSPGSPSFPFSPPRAL
jgi:hypothetical protein